MRSASLLGALALAALIGSAGLARTEPYDAVIRQDTDVRSGHGDGAMFYPTNHLHAGDRVRVVKEEDGGWLAIVPPSGSFSWIRKDLLVTNTQQQPPITMVNEDADVRIGSQITNQPPVVGKRARAARPSSSYPSTMKSPTAMACGCRSSRRRARCAYIRAEAVQAPATAVKSPTVVAVPTGNPSAPAQAQDAETLYRKAVDAEKLDPQQAVALYNQGAGVDADFNRANQARNRANWLRDSLRNPTPNIVPGLAPGADPHVAAAPNESKVYPLAGDPSAAPAVHLSAPQGAGTSSSSSATAHGRGISRRIRDGCNSPAAAVEGRKTYEMVSKDGRTPYYYLTAQPGVNLEPYVGHHVECFGEAIY